MNPFYTSQQGNIPNNFGAGGPFQNFFNLIQQFNQFRSTFKGDPRQKVQELLNSGQMTQDQFNQLSNMAEQFRNLVR